MKFSWTNLNKQLLFFKKKSKKVVSTKKAPNPKNLFQLSNTPSTKPDLN